MHSVEQRRGLAKVRARLALLERRRAGYLVYQARRCDDADWHAAWDVAVNISETEREMEGMRFVLDALGITGRLSR